MRSVRTFDPRDPAQRPAALRAGGRIGGQAAEGFGGDGVIVCAHAEPEDRERARRLLLHRPDRVIAQEMVGAVDLPHDLRRAARAAPRRPARVRVLDGRRAAGAARRAHARGVRSGLAGRELQSERGCQGHMGRDVNRGTRPADRRDDVRGAAQGRRSSPPPRASRPRPSSRWGSTTCGPIEAPGGLPVVLPALDPDHRGAAAGEPGGDLPFGRSGPRAGSYGGGRHPQLGPTEPAGGSLRARGGPPLRSIPGCPILAICRGAQALNVACGGTLVQHLPDPWGARSSTGRPPRGTRHARRQDREGACSAGSSACAHCA